MTTPVKIKSRAEMQSEAEKFCDGGYASGGRLNNETDAAKDKRMISKAVGQHETHDHPGTPKTKLKLRSGGKVSGAKPAGRADKKGRGGGKVNINIIEPAAAEGEKKQAAMQGLQAGAKLGAAQAAKAMAPGAGGPPPPGAGAGPMPPPGAMPPGQPPMRRGGRAAKC